MLSSKERAKLRAMANGIDTIVIVEGRDCRKCRKAGRRRMKARQLIKCRVLETALMTTREAGDMLAELTGSEVVQVIGSRFVFIQPDPEKPSLGMDLADGEIKEGRWNRDLTDYRTAGGRLEIHGYQKEG